MLRLMLSIRVMSPNMAIVYKKNHFGNTPTGVTSGTPEFVVLGIQDMAVTKSGVFGIIPVVGNMKFLGVIDYASRTCP